MAFVAMIFGCQSPLDSHFNSANVINAQYLLREDIHVEEGLSVSVKEIPSDIEPTLRARMDELNAQTPKHGQLKGVLEQRKMDQMRSFVGFMERIGADSFLALLEGRAIEFDSSEMQDPTSKRRQHLDSVLDSLFCA